MKYISFTFDDGRIDNYNIALPIMKKYNLTATLFCTTGYVDGSFKHNGWKSSPGAISVDSLKELQKEGWEIALHGDCHTTDLQDTIESKNKLEKWGIGNGEYGFSIPNSNATQEKIEEIKNSGLVSYIRKGRNINTKSLRARILFGLYTYLNSNKAYRKFNLPNINTLPLKDPYDICSVVVRSGDRPKHLLDFLEVVPDNTWTVLMLHSILPATHKKHNLDPWSFSEESFLELCKGVSALQESGVYRVVTMQDMVREKR